MSKKQKNDNVQNIYNDLKAKILSGDLKHEERLVEVSIAKEYDASRIHAKEAFRLLETERLVRHVPNKGFIVLGVTSDMIDEIVEIRQALEKVVFKEIIQTGSDEDINEIARLAKRFEVFVNNDMIEDALHELDSLYDKVHSMSKYKRITKILSQYGDYIDLVRNLTLNTKESMQEGVQNFNKLAKALQERNIEEMEHQLELRHTYLKNSDLHDD